MSGEPINTPGGPTLSPTRPIYYYGGAGHDTSVNAYVNGSNFPLGGSAYFDIATSGPPGIQRNSWRGPRYFATDFSFLKSTKVRIGLEKPSRPALPNPTILVPDYAGKLRLRASMAMIAASDTAAP